jgi:hypothetical protein
MRSRDLKAGDVVVVTRDCCSHYLGLVFTIEAIEYIAPPRALHCQHCGWASLEDHALVAWTKDGAPKMVVAPVAWLRRLDPPAESVEEINRLWEPKRDLIKVPR